MSRFGILGSVELYDGDRRVPVGGPRQQSLLAFLLVHANRAVSNDELVEAVWPGQRPGGAVKRLQVAIARLRKTLDDRVGTAGDQPALRSVAGGYLLSLNTGDLDADVFAAGVEEGRRALDAGDPEGAAKVLHRALGSWRGPALAEVAYEDFAQAEIRRLEELHLTALEARVDADLLLGRHAAQVAELESLVAEHPTRERLAGLLMLALYRCGRQAEALDVYQRTRAHLTGELGLEPGRALSELQAAILSQSPALELVPDSVRPALAAPPLPLTQLFGRATDLDGLLRLVGDRRTRLVTLVGPGGVGKTRLAIELARHVADDFADGARFVELAAVSDSDELASATGRALAVPMRVGEPPETALLRFLGDRHLLLVLDNFEQLVAGAGFVAELLGACPELTILITSREPTRLGAERLHPVRPLDVPVDGDDPSAGELESYDAVAMFCDRARARDPDFALDEATAPHVRDVCRRLDGLPLALELAAARVGLLCADDLAERLESALALLVGGARDAPERQRTLRATIDWSYRLLSDAERQVFARMAVFESGATVAAAETVTGASLDTLGSLVDKQLLVRRHQRLLMLETIREYARERLATDPDADEVHGRLIAWCLSFAREATPHLARADRATWLARLETELPNILAAGSFAIAQHRDEVAAQLFGELGAYWWYTNRSREGLSWLQVALDHAPSASDSARATLLLYRARLTDRHRSYEREREDLEASLALFQACDDPAGVAACLGHMAFAEAWRGGYEAAAALSEDAIRVAERSTDDGAVARALTVSALIPERYEDAAPRARIALAHLRATGDLHGLTRMCVNIGYTALAERQYQDAIGWLDDGLEAAGQLEDPYLLFSLQTNLGIARLFLDELGPSTETLSDALAVCHKAGAEDVVDETLLGLAAVDASRGNLAGAARLAGAAIAHEAAGRSTTEDAVWSRLHDEILTPARQRHGPENWDRAQREGAALTVSEAIEFALAQADHRPGRPSPTAEFGAWASSRSS